MTWKSEGDGPIWVPILNAAETTYGIPTDLLARLAYQECRFRRDIIDGTTKSSAGAVGIMQLLPEDFPEAGKDPVADISDGATYLVRLHDRFHDWQIALAAYNWGPGNVDKCLRLEGGNLSNMPIETQDYVVDIASDVRIKGFLFDV